MTDPPDACLPVEEPHFLTNFSYGRFALINGTETCGYKHKVYIYIFNCQSFKIILSLFIILSAKISNNLQSFITYTRETVLK